MTSRWPLAVFAAALAVAAVMGLPRRAEAAKSLSECPVWQAITNPSSGGRSSSYSRGTYSSRSSYRYRNTGRKSTTLIGKTTNGMKNVLVAPLEVPFTMSRVARREGLLTGLTGGAVQGMSNGFERLFGGAAEAVAAPIPGVNPPSFRRRLGDGPTGAATFVSDVISNAFNQRSSRR